MACALAIVLALLLSALPLPALASPAFTQTGPLKSDAGYFMVEWQADEPVSLEIAKQDSQAKPRVLYTGSNSALFVSGLQDGEYDVRLRDGSGALSKALTLSVEHQPLDRALWLVALGALAFLAAALVILKGARDD